MKKNIYLFATLSVSIFLLNSCEGPEGQAGPQGASGIAGVAGSNGVKGDPGVTFYATGWITATKKLLVDSYNKTDFYSGITLQAALITTYLTQKTLDGGIVMVYNREASSKAIVYAVPFDTYFKIDNHVTYSFNAEPGKVNCYISFSKNLDPSTYFVDEEYRVVIIPPASGARFANLNWKDYNEVKKVLNLND